ncbi:MAG: oligosaccharide flippase family protein [Candidatus Lokiarchaeota archaeon]|nr:oligosaccharide flippase family protein [Candidatus Lokiarchaeota archaeon]
MTEPNSSKNLRKLDSRYKTLVKNTLFSIFLSYGTFIISLLTSYLFARMITRDEWGILILASSIIGIFSILVNFLPPGTIFAMNFYIPRYRANKELIKLKHFILNTFYLRILGIVIIFSAAMIIFGIFNSNFAIFLNNHLTLLYLLSLLIILSNLDSYFSAFLIGFNLFKINLLFFIIKAFSNLIPLLFYFFIFNNITIETIALINIISLILPLIAEFLIFIFKIPKIESEREKGLSFVKVIRKIIAYGSFLRIENLISDLWRETQTQAIGGFESTEIVTGYNISRNYTHISNLFLSSITGPLIYSFSSLDYKEDYDKIMRMFKTILIYSLYLFLLLTGIFFFLSEFFLSFVYGNSYIQYSSIIKLMQISGVISIYPSLFGILLRTTNKIKILAITTMIAFPINVIFAFTGLFYFGIYGLLYAIIFFNALVLIAEIGLTIKLLKINLEYRKMLGLFLSFFIAVILTITLNDLLFDEVSKQLWSLSNLLIFEYLNIFNILSFTLIFIVLNIIFKSFSKNDLDYIEMLFTKDKTTHKFIKKLLNILKKFLR